MPAHRVEAQEELADREVLAAGERRELAPAALAVLGLGQIGEGAVERIAADILPHQIEVARKIDRGFERGELVLRLLLAGADREGEAGHHLERVRIAAIARHAALHIGVEALRVLDELRGGVDHLGIFGGELAPDLRIARLREHRMALDRPGDVEDAAQMEIAAVVADRMDIVGIEIEPGLAIGMIEGVVLPAVPEGTRHIDELGGALVALGMARRLIDPEAARRAIGERGDDIPADPPAADMVERGETAGERIGMVEIGVHRRDDSDPLGDRGERRRKRQRLEVEERVAPLDPLGAVARLADEIGKEGDVELAALGGLGQLGPITEVGPSAIGRAGLAPGTRMVAVAGEENPEGELAALAGHDPSCHSAATAVA